LKIRNPKSEIRNRLISLSTKGIRKLIFLLVYNLQFTIYNFLNAQTPFSLKIETLDTARSAKQIRQLISYKKIFPSEQERNSETQNILFKLYESGYITARYDSLVNQENLSKAYLTIGNIYKWAEIKKGNVEEEILSEIGFREQIYNHQKINYTNVEKLYRKIIAHCENNGYPFASVKLDSIQFFENKIRANLNLTKNILVDIDSIVVKGNAKISSVYFQNYIGIKTGKFYDESKIRKLKPRLQELPFIKEISPYQIVFSDKITKLIFYLENKNASQADGILGVLPDEQNAGKVLLTGDVHLKLQNSFGRGEMMDINWRKLQSKTQDLKTQFVYPFLFSTPFGVDLKFDLYKRDTTFININKTIGVHYLLSGNDFYKVFVSSKNSSLLSTKGLENLSVLPNYADVRTLLYGLGAKKEQLDYRLNPRKGYRIIVNGSAGNRTITKNSKINPALYEKLELKTVQYNFDLAIDYFIPIRNRSTIKISNSSAKIKSPTIFQNELLIFGGLKTFRGVDEMSIFASSYSIFSLEYRYLLEQNSYFHLFWNGAYYENMSENFTGIRSDTPYGFGAGVSFETKAGIFSLSYALGKQFDNPIQLRAGKVHFGIVSYF